MVKRRSVLPSQASASVTPLVSAHSAISRANACTDILISIQDIRNARQFSQLGLLAINQEGTYGNSINEWWESPGSKDDAYQARFGAVAWQASHAGAGNEQAGYMGDSTPYTPLMG